MAIYRGPGGSGDATTDATNQASVASDAAAAALVSQTAAATSAANAATSATSAANSASTATTQATSATNSATSASTSASSASTSATNAATSASNAATSATNAETAYDNFDDRYLGSKSSAPSVDNDGNALLTGALYWNSTSNTMNVWTGSAWTGLGGSSGVSSFNTRTGAVTLSSSDVTTALTYTPLNPANNLSEVTASTARTNLSVPSTTGSGATGTWNIDVLGNAGTVTNGVYTTGNQTIGGTKTFSSTISGSINGNAATVTNGVVTTGSYSNPSWITSLSETKVLPSQTGNSGKYLTTNGTSTSWATVSGGGASALDDLTDVVLTSPTTGQVLKYNGTNWINDTDSTGSGSFTYPSAGIAVSTGSAWATSLTDNSSNWNTAYTDRLKWDGGSTGLTASTGRTSLGATTVGSNLFTLTNPSAVTFPRFNADNTVSSLSASDFRTAIGAGTSSTTGTVTSITAGTGLSGGTITSSGTIAIDSTVATLTGSQTLTNKTISGSSNTLSNIANASLTNSTITINGTSTSLGGSISVGTVTSVGGTGTVSGLSLSGTVTSTGNITLGGTLSVTPSNFSSQTANTFLAAPNGTAGVPTFRAIVAADIPTLNQNTTGTASNVTGTVAIGNGGTGQTTAAAAYNALNPMTTTGDIIYEASASTAARLPIGTTGQVLTVVGGLPAWATGSGSMVYPGAGIAVSTGSAWGTSLTAPTGTLVGTTDTQTLTNKTLTDPIITGSITEDVFTITDAAGFAIDPTNGSIQLVTLGANRTPTQANWGSGESVTLMIDDGTARTITWTTIGVTWVGGSAPTLATTGYTIIELWKVSTTIYGVFVGSA